MMQVPPGESLLAGRSDGVLIFVAGWIVTAVAALLSIWLGRMHSARAKVIWTLIAVGVPVLGAVGWFALGRERRRRL